MPRFVSFRRRYRRRRPRRRRLTKRRPRRYFRRPIKRYLPLAGHNKQRAVKLRYVEDGLNLDASGGTPVYYVYRANSVYDPNYTGIGHKPTGFADMAEIYQYYVVLGSKITMRWTPTSTTNYNAGYFGIMKSKAAGSFATFANVDTILENRTIGKSWKTAGAIALSSGNARNAQVSKRYSTKKYFTIKNIMDNLSAFGAAVSTNPTTQAYYSCWVAPIASGMPAAGLNFCIIIDYIVLFYDLPDVIT